MPNKYTGKHVGLQRQDEAKMQSAASLCKALAAASSTAQMSTQECRRTLRLDPLPPGFVEFGLTVGELVAMSASLQLASKE